MEAEQLKELFKKYHQGQCSEEEKTLLENWYLEYNEQIKVDLSPRRIKAIGARIFRELPGNHTEFIKIGIRLLAAASLIGAIVTVMLIQPKYVKPVHTASIIQEITPGSNKAILTLSNGRQINLNNVGSGQIATQAGVKIIKTVNGQILYANADKHISANGKNTNNITVPNAGQWQIVLPDGTKVWLNSATSFTYPSSFAGDKERIVTLNGEAYFEVAKDKAHPFIVKSASQEIKVFGTHFNVNTYMDEPYVETALAEGSISVTDLAHNSHTLLKPGQKSTLTAQSLSVSNANLEEILAWKNGYFRFNDTQIKDVMRRLARWYDIDVEYKGEIPTDGLNGKISKNKNISQVLNALEATKTVHFVVEGRRVIVMK
jgi:transmembrane sensor